MPKRVDHAARRLQIVEAVCRITLTGGLTAATFRQVAAEAGISVRLVQYYFGSKDQLLLAVQQHVAEQSTARLMTMIEATDGSPRAILRAFLTSFIPVDEASRVAALMYASLHTAWLVDPESAPDDAYAVPQLMHATIVEQLERGPLVAGIDPHTEAIVLMTSLTGLSAYVLDGMHTAKESIAAIDYHLDRLFA